MHDLQGSGARDERGFTWPAIRDEGEDIMHEPQSRRIHARARHSAATSPPLFLPS
jgi:hypothetical protein